MMAVLVWNCPDCEPFVPFSQGGLRGSVEYPEGLYGGEISYLKGKLLKTAHLLLTVTKSHILQVVQEIRMSLLRMSLSMNQQTMMT